MAAAVQQVEALIMAGDQPHLRGRHGLNSALYDIVANGMTGIDVDKCAGPPPPPPTRPDPRPSAS